GIDDQQPGTLLLRGCGDLLDLAFAQQGCRTDCPYAKRSRCNDVDSYRLGKSFGLLDPRVGRPPRAFTRQFRNGDNRALATRDVRFAMAVIFAQDSASASPLSPPLPKLSG